MDYECERVYTKNIKIINTYKEKNYIRIKEIDSCIINNINIDL